jgi:hypothetical protein
MRQMKLELLMEGPIYMEILLFTTLTLARNRQIKQQGPRGCCTCVRKFTRLMPVMGWLGLQDAEVRIAKKLRRRGAP